MVQDETPGGKLYWVIPLSALWREEKKTSNKDYPSVKLSTCSFENEQENPARRDSFALLMSYL